MCPFPPLSTWSINQSPLIYYYVGISYTNLTYSRVHIKDGGTTATINIESIRFDANGNTRAFIAAIL